MKFWQELKNINWNKLLSFATISLVVTFVLDGIFTIWWVLGGHAIEANPLTRALLDIHPIVFMGFKLLSLFWIGVLWELRKKILAQIGIWGLATTYVGVTLLHLWGVALYFN